MSRIPLLGTSALYGHLHEGTLMSDPQAKTVLRYTQNQFKSCYIRKAFLDAELCASKS